MENQTAVVGIVPRKNLWKMLLDILISYVYYTIHSYNITNYV